MKLSLAWLSGDHLDNITISKWMLEVWFGLSGDGIDESVNLHWIIGPVLMVTFAFLGNTLFLTILVSMLNHTFAKIASNATAEIQFRRAVLTFEGVKADQCGADPHSQRTSSLYHHRFRTPQSLARQTAQLRGGNCRQDLRLLALALRDRCVVGSQPLQCARGHRGRLRL